MEPVGWNGGMLRPRNAAGAPQPVAAAGPWRGWAAGAAGPPGAASLAAAKPAPAVTIEFTGSETHEELVAMVKELQRNDADAKEQWNIYTDTLGSRTRDPMKHTEDFLRAFVEQLQSGARLQQHEDIGGLAESIKVMQRKSQSFKSVWGHFCMQFGGGKNDPLRHDPAYHVKFFDFISSEALASISFDPASAGVNYQPTLTDDSQGPPLKRKRDSSGSPVATAHGSYNVWSGPPAGADSTKEALVQRVKSFQRMGDAQKELWGAYADMYLGGVRDPSRHDATTLQEFCMNHSVPSLENASSPQWGMGGGPVVAAKHTANVSAGGEKEALVQRIKNYQRASKEQSETWKAFCGQTCDPNRHDVEKLEEFVLTYNIP